MNRALHVCLVGVMSLGAGCKHSTETDGGTVPVTTYSQLSDSALQAMQNVYYAQGGGGWNMCVPTLCEIPFTDFDWGSDSMTDALYLRWSFSHDSSIPPMMTSLNAGDEVYGTCTADSCPSWSDVPMWDSIAAVRQYEVTGDPSILTRAEAAFNYDDSATQFALGACPTVDYQMADGGTNDLKTLESDSNYIKAALLLNDEVPDAGYLEKAEKKYADVQPVFKDPDLPLYTVWVVDDGTTCTQIPHRFYASVNGNMIWAGVTLAAVTGQSSYLNDAIATGQAYATNMNDAAGVFADLQSDDDVIEPMIEGMYALAQQGQAFAESWLLTNAQAIAYDRDSMGAFGRFFDGPAPPGDVTEWQSNGALALAFVGGGMDPTGNATPNASPWEGAISVTDDLTTYPATIQFTGKAIAVFGTLGEMCCAVGHSRIFIDGTETFDQRGVWQNEVNNLQPVLNSILFAWRWPSSGSHTIQFQPGLTNPKEGGPFIHVQSYEYVP